MLAFARDCIGGVVALELLLELLDVLSVGNFEELLPNFAKADSNLPIKWAFPFTCWIRSSFMMEFVGMFGVSFSKPPCM